MSRFFEPDNETLELFEMVRRERFGSLVNARIKLIMDGKVSINKSTGKVKFGYIKKPSDVENFLVGDVEDYDYFVFLVTLPWELASPDNRKRIISHELRHTFVDEKGSYKTVPHEVEDFYAEIELNRDDPRWGADLAELTSLRYEQMKENGEL